MAAGEVFLTIIKTENKLISKHGRTFPLALIFTPIFFISKKRCQAFFSFRLKYSIRRERKGSQAWSRRAGQPAVEAGIEAGSLPGYMILIILTGIELMKKQTRAMAATGASHGFLLWPGICMLFRSIIRSGAHHDE